MFDHNTLPYSKYSPLFYVLYVHYTACIWLHEISMLALKIQLAWTLGFIIHVYVCICAWKNVCQKYEQRSRVDGISKHESSLWNPRFPVLRINIHAHLIFKLFSTSNDQFLQSKKPLILDLRAFCLVFTGINDCPQFSDKSCFKVGFLWALVSSLNWKLIWRSIELTSLLVWGLFY